MKFTLDFGGRPEDWIVNGGKPAAIWPKGLPSYEHEDNSDLRVYDLLVVQASGTGQVRMFSRWYGTACVIAPDGPVPLHHSVDAMWKWRPLIYRWHAGRVWECQGSQGELEWRFALAETMQVLYADGEYTFQDANCKADALLMDSLNPQQRIELLDNDTFRVRGFSGNLYRIRLGNGFELVSPWTGDPWALFCLHPEEWIPDADVALATKLLLEDEELEQEAIGNASYTKLPYGKPVRVSHHVLKRLEEKLI